MSETHKRIFLLTGRPGVGKTTVVRRVAEEIEGPVAGFYTEEIRDGEGRKGFRIVDFEGRSAVLAHVDRPAEPRVSKYGVDVDALDEIVGAMPEPEDVPSTGLIVVDEIGRMECLSDRFDGWIRAVLDSETRLLATVARRGEGLIADVKAHPDAEVRELTRRNRDRTTDRILAWLGGESTPGAARG